jgi:FkbM family methyltransferase
VLALDILSTARKTVSDVGMKAIHRPDEENALKERFLGTQPGFFVEVGANEPVDGSQTWHLEKLGWRGILVEPLPALAQKLREQRTATVIECACSGPGKAGTTMQLHVAGALSSFDPALMDPGVIPDRSIAVAVRTLDEVLDEAQAPSPIDFVSIDVEGHEVEVLRGFDFERWRPRLILLEDHLLGLDKHRCITAHGYRLLCRTGLNNWYVPEASPHRLGLGGRLQMFRKMYLSLPIRRLQDLRRRAGRRLRTS